MRNESWLTPDIKNSEIFPDSFDAVWKDRASDAHGGVIIAFKRDLLCTGTGYQLCMPLNTMYEHSIDKQDLKEILNIASGVKYHFDV